MASLLSATLLRFPKSQVFFKLQGVWKWLWQDEPGRVSTGFFNPGRRRQIVLFVTAVVLTIFVYTCLVTICYRSTWQTYRRVNVFDELGQKMPRVFAATANDPLSKREEMLALYLQQMGLEPAEQTVADLKANDELFKRLTSLLNSDRNSPAFYTRPTVEVLVEAVFKLRTGQDTPSWWTNVQKRLEPVNGKPPTFQSKMADLVASMLAGYPSAADRDGHSSRISEFFINHDELHQEEFERSHRTTLWGKRKSDDEVDAAWNEKMASGAEELLKTYGPKFGKGLFNFDGFQLRLTNEPAEDEEIIRFLYRQTGAQSVFDDSRLVGSSPGPAALSVATQGSAAPATGITPSVEPSSAQAAISRAELQHIERFFSGLLTRLRSHEEVKASNWWMTLCRGYEQFCMLIIFFWMVLLLHARAARRKDEERIADDLAGIVRTGMKQLYNQPSKTRLSFADGLLAFDQFKQYSIGKVMLKTCADQLRRKDEQQEKMNLEDVARQLRQNDAASRWTLIWQARALPAIGFVGTVHGISYAMMGADTLVRASTPAAQAAAVNLVAGNLGVAFSHTLIALVMGILLSWFSDRQSFRERSLISRLERELGYLIDPIGFDLHAADLRAATPFARRDPQFRLAAQQKQGFQAASALPLDGSAVQITPPQKPPRRERVGRIRLLTAVLIVAFFAAALLIDPPGTSEFGDSPTLDVKLLSIVGLKEFANVSRLAFIAIGLLVSFYWLSRWLEDRDYNAFIDEAFTPPDREAVKNS